MVDLDDTVDEVKKQVRDAEDLDHEELFEQEKKGKDRKTIKEFLEKRIDSEEETEEQEENVEEVDQQLVEQIEEETSGGLLGGFTRTQVIAGGVMTGIILGLILGTVASLPMEEGISGQQAADRVETLITAGGQMNADQVDVSSEMRNGMHYLNVTATQTVNGTEQTQSQSYYMTSNGVLMFPEQIQSPFGNQQVAIDVAQALDRANNPQPPAEETEPSGNQTS